MRACLVGQIVTVLLSAAVVSSGAEPATKPATKPVATRTSPSAARSAVRTAVTALTKEYEQFLRKPAAAEVRATCNYFTDHPDSSVTPDVIAAVLVTGGGGDQVAAYVKWQLLSGLPATVDEATGKQLLQAYRAAPLPLARPGISPEDQKTLDRLAQGRKESDEPDLKAQLDDAVNAVARSNAPILAYRDELYRRLPKNADAFAAALEDLAERQSTGAEGRDLVKALATDVRQWAASEPPPPRTLAAMGKAFRRLADTRGPQYYGSPYWRESGNGGFAWRKSRAEIDSGHALKDLAVFLDEQSQHPPLDLTIKDNKK
jgi:hypothetical protein